MQLTLIEPEEQQAVSGDQPRAIGQPPGCGAEDAMLEFGRFHVLRRRRRLLADGRPVELGTRAFAVLMILMEADGALVTKDELLRRVWPGIVVAEDNLKVQVSALRKALGEDRELIRTEFGRGYRFTAVVRNTITAGAAGSTTPRPVDATLSMELSAITARLASLETKLAEAIRVLNGRSQPDRAEFLHPRRCTNIANRRGPSNKRADSARVRLISTG
ncbi:MAG TPA: winged helix-turn-helix domain-containing protein [Stellaceae bacterium]|nr:winged helix-turn-helix domain-containing protein [Stellaceae bacterium]